MRSAIEALTWSYQHNQIPYSFVGNDGIAREVGDLECARSVMASYGVIPIDDMGTATRIWQRAQRQHGPGEEPRLGAPVCFPNLAPGKSGHIALYAGQGRAWTTPVWLRDADRRTDLYLISIADLANQCGNAYTGWIEDFAGQQINFTEQQSGEEEMKVFENVGGEGSPFAGQGAVYVGGPGVWYQVGLPGHQFVNDRAILEAVWGPIIGLHGINGKDTEGDIGLIREACLAGRVSATITDAQIKAIVEGVVAKLPAVDVSTLEKAIAAIKIPAATATIKLTPADTATIATKVATAVIAKLPKPLKKIAVKITGTGDGTLR